VLSPNFETRGYKAAGDFATHYVLGKGICPPASPTLTVRCWVISIKRVIPATGNPSSNFFFFPFLGSEASVWNALGPPEAPWKSGDAAANAHMELYSTFFLRAEQRISELGFVGDWGQEHRKSPSA